jgi:hypothetical protein
MSKNSSHFNFSDWKFSKILQNPQTKTTAQHPKNWQKLIPILHKSQFNPHYQLICQEKQTVSNFSTELQHLKPHKRHKNKIDEKLLPKSKRFTLRFAF